VLGPVALPGQLVGVVHVIVGVAIRAGDKHDRETFSKVKPWPAGPAAKARPSVLEAGEDLAGPVRWGGAGSGRGCEAALEGLGKGSRRLGGDIGQVERITLTPLRTTARGSARTSATMRSSGGIW